MVLTFEQLYHRIDVELYGKHADYFYSKLDTSLPSLYRGKRLQIKQIILIDDVRKGANPEIFFRTTIDKMIKNGSFILLVWTMGAQFDNLESRRNAVFGSRFYKKILEPIINENREIEIVDFFKK